MTRCKHLLIDWQLTSRPNANSRKHSMITTTKNGRFYNKLRPTWSKSVEKQCLLSFLLPCAYFSALDVPRHCHIKSLTLITFCGIAAGTTERLGNQSFSGWGADHLTHVQRLFPWLMQTKNCCAPTLFGCCNSIFRVRSTEAWNDVEQRTLNKSSRPEQRPTFYCTFRVHSHSVKMNDVWRV